MPTGCQAYSSGRSKWNGPQVAANGLRIVGFLVVSHQPSKRLGAYPDTVLPSCSSRRASAGVPESCGFAASHTSKQAVPHMVFLKIVVPSLAWFPLDNPLNTNQQEQIGGFPFGCPLKPQNMGVNLNKKRSQPRLSLNLVSMAGCTFPPRLPCEPHLHPDRPGSSLLSPKRPPLGGLVVFEGTLFWVAMVA